MLFGRTQSPALFAMILGCALCARPATAAENGDAQAAPDTDRLTDANFQTIYDALQPPKVEPWKSIPWHISILEAAKQAEREGKPGVPYTLGIGFRLTNDQDSASPKRTPPAAVHYGGKAAYAAYLK